MGLAASEDVVAWISRPRFQIASLGIRDLSSLSGGNENLLKSWRSGCIITQCGKLLAVRGRWWPYQGSWLRAIWDANRRPLRHDRCELYYHQPLSSPDYLSLSYVRSGPATSLSSLYLASLALDRIAEIKQCSAIVCHVTNSRISDRLMERWGWQQHCAEWSGRHFIKRFYGQYPLIPVIWRERLGV